MKWFRRWFRKQVEQAWEDSKSVELVCEQKVHSVGSRIGRNYEDPNIINFTVYSATGGKIVETIKYDSRAGREQVNRYVISEDADFSESLSKIVTMDYLR